jgi:hypothetical protein
MADQLAAAKSYGGIIPFGLIPGDWVPTYSEVFALLEPPAGRLRWGRRLSDWGWYSRLSTNNGNGSNGCQKTNRVEKREGLQTTMRIVGIQAV